MQASEVDPRDARWEMHGQVYRVDFWQAPVRPTGMWSCWETRITDVDSVTEVLTWSAAHADGRDIVVYLELEGRPGAPGSERGLVRLHGRDPTVAPAADRRDH